jgi:TRAP-type C4-dicarboxylate transport system permease small subunit
VSERPAAPSWWRRAGEVGRTIETTLIVVLLSGLIIFASAQIVLRNVFSIGVTWGDGLIRLAVLWLALLGALAASRDDRHITVGALVRWLTPRARHAAHVVASLFGAAVSGFFAWYSLLFVRDSRAFGDTLLNELPAWPLQVVMPIAFGLIAYRYLLQALRR